MRRVTKRTMKIMMATKKCDLYSDHPTKPTTTNLPPYHPTRFAPRLALISAKERHIPLIHHVHTQPETHIIQRPFTLLHFQLDKKKPHMLEATKITQHPPFIFMQQKTQKMKMIGTQMKDMIHEKRRKIKREKYKKKAKRQWGGGKLLFDK